jgi:hypothetical protein
MQEKPITKALITISNSNLDVYNAQIRLDAHFRGLRYDIKNDFFIK